MVVEGVHLSPNLVADLMARHPALVPFVVCISNPDKHRERFSVRARYMALDPALNRYIQFFGNIRIIQDYLCRRAAKYHIPLLENTNVDRSLAAVHATVFSCLRQVARGLPLWDPDAHVARGPEAAWTAVTTATWKSSDMLQVISRRRREAARKHGYQPAAPAGNDEPPPLGLPSEQQQQQQQRAEEEAAACPRDETVLRRSSSRALLVQSLEGRPQALACRDDSDEDTAPQQLLHQRTQHESLPSCELGSGSWLGSPHAGVSGPGVGLEHLASLRLSEASTGNVRSRDSAADGGAPSPGQSPILRPNLW